MKSFYIGNHCVIELDKSFFSLGIIIGWGALMIELGHLTIKFY